MLTELALKQPKCRVVYYSSWARHPREHRNKNGFLRNFDSHNGEAAAARMLADNNAAYEALREQFGERTIIARIGDAFARAVAKAPHIQLYAGDHSHATKAGSLLSAAVLYEILTGAKASDSPYTAGLSKGDAALLKALAAD